jgi:hypothetical protein
MNTSFAVTFDCAVTVFERPWHLTCTVSPRWEDPPALLWCENQDRESYFVPEAVWEAVEAELATNGPARAAFDAALNGADIPFMREAAE